MTGLLSRCCHAWQEGHSERALHPTSAHDLPSGRMHTDGQTRRGGRRYNVATSVECLFSTSPLPGTPPSTPGERHKPLLQSLDVVAKFEFEIKNKKAVYHTSVSIAESGHFQHRFQQFQPRLEVGFAAAASSSFARRVLCPRDLVQLADVLAHALVGNPVRALAGDAAVGGRPARSAETQLGSRRQGH